MADSILTFFLCLVLYRAICAGMNWAPWPVVHDQQLRRQPWVTCCRARFVAGRLI